jgi:hypothetical protein
MIKNIFVHFCIERFPRISLLGGRNAKIIAALFATVFIILLLFFVTGRIFLELFQWLLLPFPKKWSKRFNRKEMSQSL